MPLYLITDYVSYVAERIIDRFGVSKNFGDIRFQDYDIAAFFNSSDVFASDTSAEIVFFHHIRVIRNFPIHNSSSPSLLRGVR